MKKLYKKNYVKNFGKLIAFVVFCNLFVIIPCVSCKGKEAEEKQVSEATEEQSAESSEQVEHSKSAESTEVSENIDKNINDNTESVKVFYEKPITVNQTAVAEFLKFKSDITFPRGNEKPTAHEKYLNDELKFAEIPEHNFMTMQTAVVGSYVCKFYPYVELETNEDLSKLSNGTPIPFATIIPIYGTIKNTDIQYYDYLSDGYFEFEDNYNFFYKTEWNGTEGLVFGADLLGMNSSYKENYVLSLQFKNKGVLPEFYSTLGLNDLKQEVITALEQDKLVFEKVGSYEYEMSISSPDDMLALYIEHTYSLEPVFITTDLMAHTRHLVFDRTLQYVEEKFFLPRIEQLIDSFLAELYKVNTTGSITAQDETLKKATLYFQTAKAIIELCPQKIKVKDEDGHRVTRYKAQNESEILSKYSKTVQEEITKIQEASETAKSPLFTFADGSFTEEDYKQYKPRDHYVKNPMLETYFKVMMLLSRANFLIAESDNEQLPQQNIASIGLLFTELVKNNTALYNQWESIFNPLTDLVGISNELSFNEVLPLWKNYKVENFKEWSSNKKNIIEFMHDVHSKLKTPALESASIFYKGSENKNWNQSATAWRMFGTRHDFNSFIFTLTSEPQLKNRMMVSGLDIMKVFSSKTADTYLENQYKTFPDLNTVLTNLEKQFSKYPEQIAGRTYYGTVLNEIALQARFDQGSGFYFTESPAWGKKALLSAHGTWTELPQDTLLYKEPNYAERCGPWGDSSTFRTEPYPRPVHYIEPNLAYWQNAQLSTQLLLNTLTAYGLADDEISKKLNALLDICERATKIVELEIKDEPVSEDDLYWIAKIPNYLAPICLINIDLVGDLISDEDTKMATLTNIFTRTDSKRILKTAVGIPYRIYVPLNDKQGGKRIAVGYCFNYYEFSQSQEYSFSNTEWKKRVYEQNNSSSNLEYLKPKWAINISLP